METYHIRHTLSGAHGEAVDTLRKTIAERFGVQRALVSPPHMTLVPPFSAEDVTPLEIALERLAAAYSPLSVSVTGFAAFGKGVWYLDLVQEEALFALKRTATDLVQRTLGVAASQEHPETHFHITLAYKDLTPEIHGRIGDFLEVQALPITTVTVDSLALCRKRDDRGWDETGTYRFQGRMPH